MADLSRTIAVKPIIKYPREAQVGKTYLMTIDLQLEEGFEWQCEEEDYPIYCSIDSEYFSSKPIGEPAIVLHRFGESYGEAKFLLTANIESSQGSIAIILINRYGVSIKKLTLDTLGLLKEADYFSEEQDGQLELATILTRPHSRYETVEQSSTDILSREVRQEPNWIQKLSELIVEDLQSAPTSASIEQLVERLQQNERIERMIQINADNAVGFQTLVEEGGIENIGQHLHNFDERKLDQILKSFWRSLQTTGIPNNVPRSSVATFIGREAELERLHTQLQQGNLVAISSIQGMGGLGRTELAIQYTKRYESFYQGGICWLFARELNVGAQVVDFAQLRLNLKTPEGLEFSDQVAFCWRNWQEGEVLLVLDDVVNYGRDVKPYLPPQSASRFKVLMTTRLKFGPPIQSILLDVLYPEQALELLTVSIGSDRVQQELDIANTLCEWLAYLPLGIELVGRYLTKRTDLSLGTLLSRLQSKATYRQAFEPGFLKRDEVTGTSTPLRGLKAAFELSWTELDEYSQHLSKLLSLFAPTPIPWSLVQAVEQGFCDNSNGNKEFKAEELERARTLLLDFHLLQLSQQQEQLYNLHSLIRESFIEKREKDESDYLLKQSFCAEMLAAAKQIPQTITLSSIQKLSPKIPHIIETVTTLEHIPTNEDLIISLTRIAWFYQGQIAYKEAEQWYLRCLEVSEQRLGNNHSDVAVSLNNLAALYELQGRYGESEPLFVRSLSILQQQLSNDHPEIASSLNNLAELYRSQGRYSEAEPLYIRSLSIRQQQLGTHHPETATSLNNLAGLYCATGRYIEAEPLMVQALSVRQKYLGDDHPDTATSFNNLALLYQIMERFNEAEELCIRSLEIRQRLLGRSHPNTAASLNSLAGLYYAAGRFVEAEPLMRQVLDICRKQLGENHPDTAIGLNNLAELYSVMGRYNDAKPLYENALRIYELILGINHPRTISTRENLAALYRSMQIDDELIEKNTSAINLPALDPALDSVLESHLEDSRDVVSNITASAIAVLAFQKFFELAANELAKKFTTEAIGKMDILLKRIWTKLRGEPRVEKVKATVEQTQKITPEQINQIAPYLQVAMDEDPEFANDIRLLAQEINAGKLVDQSSMTMNVYDHAKGWQTKVEGGTAYIGELHQHNQ